MMIQPRFMAHLAAVIGGYFWLPCPICDEYFAGFEHGDTGLMTTPTDGRCVCSKPECQSEARRANRAKGLPEIVSAES